MTGPGALRPHGSGAHVPLDAEPAQRTTLYHSDFRDACRTAEGRRIAIRLVGRVARVVERERSELPVAPFMLQDDDTERAYVVDNDAIRALLNTLRCGELVHVRAEGGKGEERLTVWRDDGTELVSGTEAETKVEPAAAVQEGGPGLPPERRLRELDAKYAGRDALLDEWRSCLLASADAGEYFRAIHHREPTEAELLGARLMFAEVQRSLGRRRVRPSDDE